MQLAARALDPGTQRPHLSVPADFRARYDAAIAAGRALGERLAATGPASLADFDRFVREQVAASITPPPLAGVAGELAELHAAEGNRTLAGNLAADWHARHGVGLLWAEPTKDLLGRLPAADARRAQALLEQAGLLNYHVTDAAKKLHARLRPYEVDSTLTTVVPRPRNNASWPSGHASGAVTIGVLLGAQMADRAAALLDDAAEVAWSRIYGGVHFPSDVIEGVRIGAAIGAALAARAT